MLGIRVRVGDADEAGPVRARMRWGRTGVVGVVDVNVRAGVRGGGREVVRVSGH